MKIFCLILFILIFDNIIGQEITGTLCNQYNKKLIESSYLFIAHKTKSVEKILDGSFEKRFVNHSDIDSLFINAYGFHPIVFINLPKDRNRIELDTIQMFEEYVMTDKTEFICDFFDLRCWFFARADWTKHKRENKELQKEFKNLINEERYYRKGLEYKYKIHNRQIVIDLSNPE